MPGLEDIDELAEGLFKMSCTPEDFETGKSLLELPADEQADDMDNLLATFEEKLKLDTKKSKAALSFTSNMEKVDIGKGYVDDLLIKSAREGKLIATNDKELLLRLKKEKINALRIREKNKLVMTETE